jgi:RNA polymerase sigma factor (sigma-70 family)
MQTPNDLELLRDYSRHKSESAFGEIVRRYAPLVYSAAVRQTGDSDAAHDVAQIVFSDLARKAGSVSDKTLLAGWLYQGVRLQALEQRRKNQRRERRERQAMDNFDSPQEPESDWSALRPVLDNVMADLPVEDRDALLLRFFKNESLATVGVALGISEDAAQKRVARALGKLREILSHRGIGATAAALSTNLAANAVETVPGGFATAWMSAALAHAQIPPAGILAMSNMKAAVVILALTAGLALLTVQHIRLSRERDSLKAALQSQSAQLASLRAEIEQLNARPAESGDETQLRELVRLRAKADRLRSDLQIAKASEGRLAERLESQGLSTNDLPVVSQITFEAKFFTSAVRPATGCMSETQTASVESEITNDPSANVIGAPKITTLCGRQAHIATQEPVPFEGGTTNLGVSLDVVPTCSASSNTIGLTIVVQATRLKSQDEIEEVHMSTSLDAPDGNTLIMATELPSGVWFEGDSTNYEGPRHLILLLTPTLIDAAGNRLNEAAYSSAHE